MRKLVLLAGLFLVFLAACKKDDNVYDPGPQLTKDMNIIKNYLTANSLTATLDSTSGISYKIIAPGNGVDTLKYNGSKFSALYKGSFISGQVFDSTTTTARTFTYSNVIVGWQFAVRQISKGGKIRLYLPSLYGYGPADYNGIPANSVLIFDIEMTDVDNVVAP